MKSLLKQITFDMYPTLRDSKNKQRNSFANCRWCLEHRRTASSVKKGISGLHSSTKYHLTFQ